MRGYRRDGLQLFSFLNRGTGENETCFHCIWVSSYLLIYMLPIFIKWNDLLKIIGQPVNTNKMEINSGLNFFILTFLYGFLILFWLTLPFEVLFSFLKWSHLCSFLLVVRENEADNPMPSSDLYTSAVFWCCSLSANEWEEAHLDLSCMWQESCLWKSNFRWVSMCQHKY